MILSTVSGFSLSQDGRVLLGFFRGGFSVCAPSETPSSAKKPYLSTHFSKYASFPLSDAMVLLNLASAPKIFQPLSINFPWIFSIFFFGILSHSSFFPGLLPGFFPLSPSSSSSSSSPGFFHGRSSSTSSISRSVSRITSWSSACQGSESLSSALFLCSIALPLAGFAAASSAAQASPAPSSSAKDPGQRQTRNANQDTFMVWVQTL